MMSGPTPNGARPLLLWPLAVTCALSGVGWWPVGRAVAVLLLADEAVAGLGELVLRVEAEMQRLLVRCVGSVARHVTGLQLDAVQHGRVDRNNSWPHVDFPAYLQ